MAEPVWNQNEMKCVKKGRDVLNILAGRYHGLYLPVQEGMSKSLSYRSCVLSGNVPDDKTLPGFVQSDEDELFLIPTPAGEVEVIYLHHREDFELFIQKISCRCEPVPVRPDIGAMLISGVINWEKINRHREEYLKAGNTDWKEEFRRFTSDGSNFKDRVLIVSGGPYSNVSADEAGYSPEEWRNLSRQIRIYHECTHYVCQKLWPERKDAVADEVTADSIGLYGALGRLDANLCRRFLGIDEKGNFQGGRLSAYVKDPEALHSQVQRANTILTGIEAICDELEGQSPFDVLSRIMEAGLW